MAIGKAGCEHLAEWRVELERLDDLVGDEIGLDELPYASRQVRGQHAPVLQRPEPLENDGYGDDRGQDDGTHHPAASTNDLPHRLLGPVCALGIAARVARIVQDK